MFSYTQATVRVRWHGTGRIFERLKPLIGHFVHTGSFHILCFVQTELWTAIEASKYSIRLGWFRVNLTPKRTNFQPLENSSGAAGVNVTLLGYFLAFALFPFLVLIMSLPVLFKLSKSFCCCCCCFYFAANDQYSSWNTAAAWPW